MANATKYHVNKETGRAGVCRATKKGCPLGEDTPHFNTKEEAKEYIEKNEAENNNAFSTVKKNAPKSEAQQKVEKIQKEIDDLNEIKKQAEAIGNKAVVDTINGQIRGKSIHLSNYKRQVMAQQNRSATDANDTVNTGNEITTAINEKLSKDFDKYRALGYTDDMLDRKMEANKALYEKYPALAKRYVISPAESKVIAPPREATPNGGYNGGSRFVGGKYNSGYYDRKAIAADVREDIKTAIKLGELPNDHAYGVRVSSYGGGVDIIVGKKDGRKMVPPDEDFYLRDFDRERGASEYDAYDSRASADYERWGQDEDKKQYRVETDEALQLKEYLTALGNQYGHQEIDSMSDYYSSYGMCDVKWKNEYN